MDLILLHRHREDLFYCTDTETMSSEVQKSPDDGCLRPKAGRDKPELCRMVTAPKNGKCYCRGRLLGKVQLAIFLKNSSLLEENVGMAAAVEDLLSNPTEGLRMLRIAFYLNAASPFLRF